MLLIEKIFEVSEDEKRGVCKGIGVTLEEFWNLVEKIHEYIDKSEHLPNSYDTAMVWGSILNSKANLEQAKVFIENFYRVKNLHADILFYDCVPSSKWFKESTASTINVCTSKLTPSYQRVHCFKYTDPDGRAENMYSYLLTLVMVCMIRGHYDFASSTVFICDMQELTYKTLVKHSVHYVLVVRDILQSIHLRIHGLHYVNGPSMLETFLSIIRSTLPAKLKDRIHVHKDFDSLHKFVPKECLPKDYGGTDKPLEKLHEDWIEAMRELEPHFQKLKEAKSTKKYEFDDATKQNLGLGVEGSFKKLEID